MSAQTKKPTPKTGQPPKPVPNAKSKDAVPAIPGLPPNMPAALREGIIKQLQQQLDERSARRKQAGKEADAWVRRAATE